MKKTTVRRKRTRPSEYTRVGFGYDVHRFVANRTFVLGGITISHERGLEGHSDADVLLHAICDALLGAAVLEDIGHHFPNTDPAYRNISSLELLQHVALLLKKKHFGIINIDSTVVLERPKIAEHVPAMRKAIATALRLSIDCVSVKATTNETLGAIGRGEGCAAFAVASIRSLR
jgi:2-C-methyl-D-erythritol 2,4-cyclodiphosphate synthase